MPESPTSDKRRPTRPSNPDREGGGWFHSATKEPPTSLGTAIKLRRTELGLSRRELAERAELSYPYVAELENGAKQGSPRALEAIATALELRPSELLAWSDDLDESRGMSPSDPQHWRNRRASSMPEGAAPRVRASPAVSPRPLPLRAKGGVPRGGGETPPSPQELAARIVNQLRDAAPADAEEALLMVLGSEKVREIVRDELQQQPKRS